MVDPITAPQFPQQRKITCPGVWLCSESGYVEVTIKILRYFFKTRTMLPHFPLLCHDNYTMEGYFSSVGSMAELHHVLAAEQVELTLWQNGRRLAFFVGKLGDVLEKNVPKLCCEHNVNVQLLMKPTKAFPGIIAPKIELTANVELEDRLLGTRQRSSSILSKNAKSSSNILVTPTVPIASSQQDHAECHHQLEPSNYGSNLEIKRRQEPVCHAQQKSPTEHSEQLSQGNHKYQFKKEVESDRNSYKSDTMSLLSDMSNFSKNFASSADQSCKTNRTAYCRSNDSRRELRFPDNHQMNCEICQAYRKIFELTT